MTAHNTRNDNWARSAMIVGALFFGALGVWALVPAMGSSAPLGDAVTTGILSLAVACSVALASLRPLHAPEVATLGMLASLGVGVSLLSVSAPDSLARTVGAAAIGVSIPFATVLGGTWRRVRSEGAPLRGLGADVLTGYLEMAETQRGETVADLSSKQTVMLVFLRQLGCTFCRETLSDLASRRDELARRGVRPVVVYMSSEPTADEIFAHYGLSDIDRVRDSELELYRVFGLGRGSLWQVFGPFVWWRGIRAGLIDGHGVGDIDGDALRMPGVFLVRDGVVVHAYRHKSVAARPDYVALASCVDRRC